LTGYSVALLLAAITRGVVGLILIAADATEREHRKW
jgi:ribosomal protein L7Ae-like RNA K-turn-binding protein